MNVGTRSADALVQARLGRPPQDALEAAVVLEAWGGVRGDEALGLGRRITEVAHLPGKRQPAPAEAIAPPPERWLRDGLALVAGMIALALWSVPLGNALGMSVVAEALRLALPAGLALVWLLRGRDEPGRGALAHLRSQPGTWLAACALLATPALLAPDETGALGSLLAVWWAAAGLLAARAWTIAYAVAAAALAAALALGAPIWPALAAGGAIAAALGIAAIVRSDPALTVRLSWRRELSGTAIGLALGLLLGASATDAGASLVVAFVPAALAGLWAGIFLSRLAHVLAGSLAQTALGEASSSGGPRRLLLGASLRLLALALPLSLGLAAVALALGADAATTLEVALVVDAVALATLPIALLDALERDLDALAAVWAGAAVALLLLPAAGAAVTLILGAAFVVRAGERHDVVVATRLWIR